MPKFYYWSVIVFLTLFLGGALYVLYKTGSGLYALAYLILFLVLLIFKILLSRKKKRKLWLSLLEPVLVEKKFPDTPDFRTGQLVFEDKHFGVTVFANETGVFISPGFGTKAWLLEHDQIKKISLNVGNRGLYASLAVNIDSKAIEFVIPWSRSWQVA